MLREAAERLIQFILLHCVLVSVAPSLDPGCLALDQDEQLDVTLLAGAFQLVGGFGRIGQKQARNRFIASGFFEFIRARATAPDAPTDSPLTRCKIDFLID